MYLEMRNCEFKEICIGLEVCIKDCDEFIVLDIFTGHCRVKVVVFVSCSDQSIPGLETGLLANPVGRQLQLITRKPLHAGEGVRQGVVVGEAEGDGRGVYGIGDT
nr:hypothetical protein Iba_chr13aCG9940 [Ipomoea batatas]